MLSINGPLLSVDVGTQMAEEEQINDVLESFIGGRGVGTSLAHDRIPFDADPFGAENAIVFATGPMQTSQMSFTGRTSATALSPLTDGLLSTNAGGFVSRHIADTGYSAIEITGTADELLAVHVRDDGVRIETVPELQEATVPQVDAYMDEEHDIGEDQIVAIGPAGENRVRFASLMTSESRAFGRGGLGAVLGSKNVKCVTFGGDSRRPVSVPDVQQDIHREAATSESPMKEQGTTSVTDLANQLNALPTEYFSRRQFEGVEGINGDAVGAKKYKKGTCSACAFACKLPTRDEESGVETEGPEFETVMAFGSNVLVDDVVAVMKSNQLCDEYGMDTISCGDVVAAYLASTDAFGAVDLIHETIEKIAYREGVGDTLAEGIDRSHQELGVENWSVKGLEFPAHDGRRFNGQGLSFAVSNRGADHMYATFYAYEYPLVDSDLALDPDGLEGKPSRLVEQENKRALEDCGIICRFSRDMMSEERFERLFDASYETLLNVGNQVVQLERHFNNQRGFDRSDDVLPYDVPGMETALDNYYEERGWTEDGIVPDRVV